MPKLSGVNHLRAVNACEKLGFRIVRQGKHIIMTNGEQNLTIPRNNPVDPFTMGSIVEDAGVSIEEFRKLL